MDVPQAFTLDAQAVGPPDARADEHGAVAVPKQVVHAQRAADGRIGADAHAQFQQALLITVQDALGQAEGGNAVAQDAADAVVGFENGHGIAALGQNDGNGQSGRARADDGGGQAILGRPGRMVGGQEALGDIVLDAADVHGTAFFAQNAMSLALFFMVADQGTDNGEGIVVKKHLPGFVDIPVQKLLDHYRNIGVDGAARAAERLFAVQAAPGFVDDMQRHGFSLYEVPGGVAP